MRALLTTLPFLFLVACSSSSTTPNQPADATPGDQQKAAANTDQCLDNPDLALTWGECNVKTTVFNASSRLAKCRQAYPEAKGTVNFELRIKPDGHVKSAKAVGAEHHGKHTVCVAHVLRRLKFAQPPQGVEATITVPYQLEP